MKGLLTRLLLAAGLAFVSSEARRPSPKQAEKDNGKRHRPVDEGRIQEEAYPEFDAVMKVHGYEWAPYEVVTEDQWVLTMFQVTRKHGSHPHERNDSPPILVIPGSFSDATSWLESA